MIELTQEMIEAYRAARASLNREQLQGRPPAGRDTLTLSGLKAVLALIDPVPDDVQMITDKQGDDYYRLADGGNVWHHECGCCFSTFAKLQATVGPMTWGTDDER